MRISAEDDSTKIFSCKTNWKLLSSQSSIIAASAKDDGKDSNENSVVMSVMSIIWMVIKMTFSKNDDYSKYCWQIQQETAVFSKFICAFME